MLEYGFNELDNDFVTLWSKKLVSDEDFLIFRDLTKLAELGQINAIQSWYLLAQRGDNNEVIDNIVKNLGNSGANALLARANKNLFDTDIIIELSKWWALEDEGFLYRDNDEFRDLTERLRHTVFCCYLAGSIEAYYDNYEITHNPLVLERFYEMMRARKIGYKNLIQVKCKASSTEFSKLRKTLLEMYEQDKNNVAVAFALGKNLTLFKSNDKLKALGSKILTDLSMRELSSTLQDYEVKGTKRLIKQQIDANTQVEEKGENLSVKGYDTANVLTPEQLGIDEINKPKGKTTVIKGEISNKEIEQHLESARKHDTELGL